MTRGRRNRLEFQGARIYIPRSARANLRTDATSGANPGPGMSRWELMWVRSIRDSCMIDLIKSVSDLIRSAALLLMVFFVWRFARPVGIACWRLIDVATITVLSKSRRRRRLFARLSQMRPSGAAGSETAIHVERGDSASGPTSCDRHLRQ